MHQRRGQIDRGDPAEHGERHDAREHDLRQVAAEVRLEPIDALDAGRRDLGRLDAVERRRLCTEPSRYELEPELGQDVGGRPRARELEAPREQPSRREGERQQYEVGSDRAERRAVERLRDDSREQRCLHEHEQRGRDPERHVDAEQHPDRPCTADEARVEGAHEWSTAGQHAQLRSLFRSRLVAAEPVAKHVVRPALVDQYEWDEDRGDHGQHHEA